MQGSSQRLWRAGGFVVKEFPYDTSLDSKRRAAAFEHAVWRSGTVLMPEPIPSVTGEFIVKIRGSRDATIGVRVHRYIEGVPPVDVSAEAGAVLRLIQDAGRDFAPAATTLHWWGGETVAVPETALRLIERAERKYPSGTFTHCDHKPQNSLLTPTGVAVLDWDECGHFPARLEAVESALRWSSVGTAPDRGQFLAFLDAYGLDGPLEDIDFAKWVAALVGWATFQTRRARGEFPDDTAADRAVAQQLADDALRELDTTLASLDEWVRWLD